MDAHRHRRARKTEFVSKVGRLSEMYVLHAELKAQVTHEWADSDGMRWAVILFNGRPYLACEEDVR